MGESETWTVGRLLEWTAGYLKEHDAESPRLDAEILLAEALGCRRIELYTSFDQVPDESPRTAFRELVRRRSEGTPVAYLVGRREFYSIEFRVTPDVLIPRPETELLVMTLLDRARERTVEQPITIADVGTGSGIIAVCAAKHLPDSRVTAIDVSPAALKVAQQNAMAHGVADRIEWVESDLFDKVDPTKKFDFIASNPPYVSTSEEESLAREIKNHEPHGALVAGPQGTEVIDRLIPQAADRLNPGGRLLIEISPMIHESVVALLQKEARLEPGQTVLDQARLPRTVQAVRK